MVVVVEVARSVVMHGRPTVVWLSRVISEEEREKDAAATRLMNLTILSKSEEICYCSISMRCGVITQQSRGDIPAS